MDLLAQGNDALHLWTRKAVSDVQRFEMELEDVADLVKTAITRGRYIGSEWCVSKPNGPWAACDSYQLRFKQWIAAAHRDMDFDYYIKFAIAATGRLLLIVSCHPPEDRG